MRLSQLAETTGVPAATLKFYLREGLLPAGEALSRTEASYGPAHAARVRLIRALVDAGGLSLATVRRVLTAMDDPEPAQLDLLQVAAEAIPLPVTPVSPDTRARAWIDARGWVIAPGDPLVGSLERAWGACDEAGIGLDESRLDAYADAVESIARMDLGTVPSERAAAVHQIILGTVLMDPVLAIVRRLAHQHLAVSAQAGTRGGPGTP